MRSGVREAAATAAAEAQICQSPVGPMQEHSDSTQTLLSTSQLSTSPSSCMQPRTAVTTGAEEQRVLDIPCGAKSPLASSKLCAK